MDERSEKIIALTREIVRTNKMLEPESTLSRISMSFKTLCLATCLAAIGGGVIAEWHAEAARPINRYEKTELRALVFYAARLKNLNEDAVLQSVRARFNVTVLDDLTEHDFPAARRFLQDKIQ